MAYRLQILSAEKVLFAIRQKYGKDSQIYIDALDDMKRTIGWSRLAAEMADDDDKDHDRRRIIDVPNVHDQLFGGGPRMIREEDNVLYEIEIELGIKKRFYSWN